MIENIVGVFLTPSEQLLLRADEFVPAASALHSINMIGSVELLHRQGKVQARRLSYELISAALLAAQQNNNLNLAIGKPGGLAGLASLPGLIAKPTGAESTWPKGTLESRLVALVQNHGLIKVHRLVYEVLGRDYYRYFNLAPELVMEGLATRDLLNREQTSPMLVFQRHYYSLPDRTRLLVAGQSVASVKTLLSDYWQDNPRLWKLLQAAIKKGMESRMDNSPSD